MRLEPGAGEFLSISVFLFPHLRAIGLTSCFVDSDFFGGVLGEDSDETYAALSGAEVGGGADASADVDSDDDVNGAASYPSGPVSYSYSFFHFIFALASMFLAMLMTGWGRDDYKGAERVDVGWASVWVKMCSVWVTAGLYTWSLIAPALFPDREFM